MKPYRITLFTLLTYGLSLTHCESNESKNLSDNWYEDTKTEILKQSDLKADSIVLSFNEDSTFKKEQSYSDGHIFLLKGYNKGILRLETHYSKDGNFELRREICDNGNFGFEGIVYNGNFYGLSTWNYCNGKLDHQGIRYNDKKVGIWKKFDENGNLIDEKDYKNIEKIDSMPIINK